MQGRVYSYMRFSAAKQSAGASAVRQADFAKNWAADNGMALDDALSMRDEGLSAYHQKHVKAGALGAFLAAIDAGRVPAGSVLIVEGLDRLSRAEPILAQAQLAQIINASITVVTASDGKQYNRERLKANPMDLVYSLLVMIRAHEESETKSKRVADALRRKCETWVAGSYRGKVSCGADPSWVRWNGQAFELVEETAAAIRLTIQLFTDGYGAIRILQILTEKGMRVTGDGQAGNINQLVGQSHLFIGNRLVTASGTPYLLEGYYPRLITDDDYSRLQLALNERRKNKRSAGGKSAFPGLFTGLGIATCGRCGGAILTQNLKRPAGYTGPCPVYRRLRCAQCELQAMKNRKDVKGLASCNSDVIERAMLDYCSDQMNLQALNSGTGDRGAELRQAKAQLAARVATLESSLQKIIEASLSGDTIPQALLRKGNEIEQQLQQEKDRDQLLSAELATLGKSGHIEMAEVWADLRDDVLALDYDARIRCRKIVGDTFAKVQIFFQGSRPGTPQEYLDMLLISHSGTARMLRVNRKTGELVRGLNRAKQTRANDSAPESPG